MRDDFTLDVKRTLAARVGSACSNPDCRALTSGPQDDPGKAINVGVAAHITGAAEGGPRYNPNLTPEKRRSIDNGIWLCQNCAHLIDSDFSRYTEELLHAWKTVAEDRARNSIGKTAAAADTVPRLELYLQPEGIVRDTYNPRGAPVRSIKLGIKNVGSGTAKFPSIRYKRACGLTVDNFGIDGCHGFGLPQSPSDSQWETFRGGGDHVIHPNETINIAKLIQRGTDKGKDGLPLPTGLEPTGRPLANFCRSYR